MKKHFFYWLVLYFLFYFGLAQYGLQLKNLNGWTYNYTLPVVYFFLTFFAVKWGLLAKESFSKALPACLFVLLFQLAFYGAPHHYTYDRELAWQLLPSFFEEVIFRGTFLYNLGQIEKNIKPLSFLKFPLFSILIVSYIFTILHPAARFSGVFEMSVWFSLIFLVTGSYLGAGLFHYISNIADHFWV